MRRFDRYIFAEILGPLALGFLIYSLILVLQFFFQSADMIIRRGVPAETVGRLVLLYLPSIVVVTIPMALLYGIIIATGRLSADSELVALRASGLSLFSLYRPIVFLALLLGAFNLYLSLEVLPEGNRAWQRLRFDILQESFVRSVEPRVFYSEWPGKTFYVFEAPPGEERWKGVFLTDSVPGGSHELVVADWGEAFTDEVTGATVLRFENAYQHFTDLTDPHGTEASEPVYQLNFSGEYTSAIGAAETPKNRQRSISRGLRELSLEELRDKARRDPDPLVRNLARAETHKKFAIPAVCVVFALFGLPLGFTNQRGGRSSGFAVSTGIFLLYWVLISLAEDLVGKGSLPAWAAIWFPNVALLSLSLWLLVRKNRDRNTLLLPLPRRGVEGMLNRMQRNHETRKKQRQIRRATEAQERRRRSHLVIRFPGLYWGFPSSIDRYILGLFVKVLTIVTLSCLTVYLVSDFTGKMDRILANNASWSTVADYYKYKALTVFYEIAPIIMLVTTLTTFGLLSRNNEVTAAKALGVSLYRLAMPAVVVASLAAGACGLLQSKVLAAANERAEALEAVLKGEEVEVRSERADRQWMFGKDRFLYNFQQYDAAQQRIYRLQVFEFDAAFRMVSRLLAESATYADDGWWKLTNGWTRTFDGQRMTYEPFEGERKAKLPEAPDFFSTKIREPEQMSYDQLQSYIDTLQQGGRTSPALEVELHNKIAYPTTTLVLAFVALPFSFLLGRRGSLYGIGVSIMLTIVFLALLATFKALGETAVLPPLIAVWAPPAIFSLFAVYLFLGIRT